MPKLVKFQTAKDIVEDAEVLATIMEGLVETSARLAPDAELILCSAEWLQEVIRHVTDAVPEFSIRISFGGTDISQETLLQLLNGSMDQLYAVVDAARAESGDATDDLRARAAGAYVSAAITAYTVLEAPTYRPEMLDELRRYAAGGKEVTGGQRDPALSLLN